MPEADASTRSRVNTQGRWACAIPGCRTRISKRNLRLCTDCWQTWGGPAANRPGWLRVLINLEEKERYKLEHRPPEVSLDGLLQGNLLDLETMAPYCGRSLSRARPRTARRLV